MADDRPAMTPHPWPDLTEPTTDEFLPWFLQQSTEAQAWLLERMREDASRGRACWLMDHEGQIGELRDRVRAGGGMRGRIDWDAEMDMP